MQSFADRDGWIWYDGEMVPWREAKVHVLSHGLHYASGVFEGERAYGGTIFKLQAHTERLIDGAGQLGMAMPYTATEINDACNAVCAANDIADGYIRPLVWRGSEMMGVSAQSTKIHMAIAAWQWPSYFSPEARLKGIKLQWSQWRRPDPATIPAKTKATGLYMICTLSKHAAEAEGFDDALMLDWRGRLAEATGANIFLAINGELHTPTPDCFLDGITRQAVIGLAHKRQIPVVERVIMPEELEKADEVFLTGTAAEVTPVGRIGDLSFTPGELSKLMIEDFTALTKEAESLPAHVGAAG